MEEKRRMFVEMPIKVHSYDVDYMQIVNNTPILAETHVKYQRSVTLDSKPVGRVWLSELGASKWTAQFEIVEGETVYCTGSQVGYYFNLDHHRPVRFPESFVNYYNSL